MVTIPFTRSVSDGSKRLYIRVYSKGGNNNQGYWSFKHSELEGDELKIYKFNLKYDDWQLVERWLEWNGRKYEIRQKARGLIKQMSVDNHK